MFLWGETLWSRMDATNLVCIGVYTCVYICVCILCVNVCVYIYTNLVCIWPYLNLLYYYCGPLSVVIIFQMIS